MTTIRAGRDPAIDAALRTAATLTGMEVVFIGAMDDATFRFDRIRGAWNGLAEGMVSDRTDSFCHRMLGGAPNATSNAADDPYYADAPIRTVLGITSYVGVPIRHPSHGAVVGTLCGIDHRNVAIADSAIGVLHELANIVATHLLDDAMEGVVIRRTPAGWSVGSDSENDLMTAIVLADLLQSDLTPKGRPDRPDQPLDELGRLKLAVSQLEHALAARVTVEQAIGVLAQRFTTTPRDAFERLRKVARRNGLRVHDLSRDVVTSVTSPVTLPEELRAR